MCRVKSVTIRTNQQGNEMINQFKTDKPKIGAFDTETDSLHIILARPFLFQFGWICEEGTLIRTYAVDLQRQPDLSRQVIKAWHKLAASLEIYLAHNIKFDLNILCNIDLPYTVENVSDTMFYIRYAHDNLTEKFGGPPLKLKNYCAKYVDPTAKNHERRVAEERTAIASNLNNKLKQRLSYCGAPPPEYGAKTYTTAVLAKIFQDPLADANSLPSEATRAAYDDWLYLDVPGEIRHKVTSLITSDMIPYSWCNREVVTEYAHYDIVLALKVYTVTAPVVIARGNMCGVEIENSLIYPLLEMERVCFQADKQYVLDAQVAMKAYIIQQRNALYEKCGEIFSIAQHAKILSILQEKFNLHINTTRDEDMSLIKSNLKRNDPENPVIEVISLIQELRTLEKWYSTYILRFVNELKVCDRLYTTINQVGTVSGRVTSDFQQFPKDGITTVDGVELFCPRKMITVTGGDYKAIVYLDFSQVELRVQALYTILVGHPDLNLCRAYMPYNCHTFIEDEGHQIKKEYDYTDDWCTKHAYNLTWYYNEEPDKVWVATDVHGATTKAAFGITEDDPDFHSKRYVGKRVNFAKNYGAQLKKICEMFPEYSKDECVKIDGAYYTAFPGVKHYHDYCYLRAQHFSYTASLFGPRYYGVNGHKLINMLVQGSSAYYLKLKIRQLYDYSKAHNIKTRWQMQIHDELSWEYYSDDDPAIFFEFKRIMEDAPELYVPLVAEMEATTTTWKAKKGIDNLESLQVYLSA